MSKRRMFSQSIVESDAFLDMPLGTQALYFHLCMNADDDGFVSPKRIMRMVGANDDDLKILVMKRFILAFESGIIVIKHWPTNNFIRTDRYKTTPYKIELSSLTKNENGDYTEKANMTTKVQILTEAVTHWDTNGIPDGSQTVDPGKVRLGKVSTSPNGLVNLDEPNGRDDKAQKTGMNTREFFARLVTELGFTDQIKATDGRIRKLKVRLKTHTPKELIQAARAIAANPYMQGDNESGTRYGKIDYLLRSDENVAKWLEEEQQQAAGPRKTFGVEDMKKYA